MRNLKLEEVHMMLGVCVRYLQDRVEQERRDGPPPWGAVEEADEKNHRHRVQHCAKISAFASAARCGKAAYDSIGVYAPEWEGA